MHERYRKFMINILSLAIIICSFFYIYNMKNKQDEMDYIEINYTVKAGDSLWKIAGEHLPDTEDRRGYIYEIKKLNNLQSTNLQIGQELIILTKEE